MVFKSDIMKKYHAKADQHYHRAKIFLPVLLNLKYETSIVYIISLIEALIKVYLFEIAQISNLIIILFEYKYQTIFLI